MNTIPSTRCVYEYALLANDFLDDLPANGPEDFNRIIEALRGLLNNVETASIPEPLKGKVESIRDLLDPAMGYCHPEHYDRFKIIIRDKIAAKVNEIAMMSRADKDLYVEKQRKQRELVSEQHKKMSGKTAPKPGEMRHSCSEQEMHRYWQQRLNSSELPSDPRTGDSDDEEFSGGPLRRTEEFSAALPPGTSLLEFLQSLQAGNAEGRTDLSIGSQWVLLPGRLTIRDLGRFREQ